MLASLKETVLVLTGDLRGKHGKRIIGYLLLSLLFLLYVYAGKNAFLKKGGYGIPAAIAAASENRKEVSRLAAAYRSSRDEAQKQVLGKKLRAARVKRSRARLESRRTSHFLRYAGWYLSGFVILFLLPVIVIRTVPGLREQEFGLGLGDWKLNLKVFLLLLAGMLVAVGILVLLRVQGFLRYYPMYARGHFARDLGSWFLLLEFFYLLYFIGWEFYFRALLLFPLEKHLGPLTPLAGVLPFAIMHIGKPVPEVFGSILAAYFLGVLVLRTRSFWICPLLHFLIAFAMDFAAVLHRGIV